VFTWGQFGNEEWSSWFVTCAGANPGQNWQFEANFINIEGTLISDAISRKYPCFKRKTSVD